jgi:hypothetical protein
VSSGDDKIRKKKIKAQVKRAKAAGKALAAAGPGRPPGDRADRLPPGVGVTIRRQDDSSELVVSGLRHDQLRRILPQINREVLIAVTEERSSLRAAAMRFVREGAFQTLIKIVAGLVVGYILVRFGLR